MSIKKTDVLGNLVYASVSMSCASEIPGYNGSLFAISDDIKERIESDLTEARAAVAELITELRNAHEIIKLAMHHVPAYARSPWLLAIEDAGFCGDGITRFHERKALLDRVGGVA